MATGFPVKANYATGDVLTAANMNDLSGTVNYLQYMTPRNPVLNSAFNVWQRGTSLSLNASTSYATGYTADRWQTQTGANQACTISRQATGDTTNLPNIQYAMRYQRNSGQTGTGILGIYQSVETLNSIPFAGKTVTLSFYARAGANFSATSNLLYARVFSGTGTDQNVFTYTGSTSLLNSTATLTTTWQRFTFNATIGATATEIAVGFEFNPTGTAGTNDYFEVTGVQLELGSSANSYVPNQPTYQGELAACQRYYWRNSGGTAYNNYCSGTAYSTTETIFVVQNPVRMRVSPTALEYSGVRVTDSVTSYTFSSASINQSSPDTVVLFLTGSTGLTQYRPMFIRNENNTSGYIALTAEL